MVATVIKGKGAMPPRGGDASLTDEEITRAVVHMANQSGGKFKEPSAPKQAAKPEAAKPAVAATPAAPANRRRRRPAAEAKPAAVDGKAVYDQVCVACHAQSIAGSPRLGDRPRGRRASSRAWTRLFSRWSRARAPCRRARATLR